MSHSKNSIGDGYPRVGIFSTNSNQHDGRPAGQDRWSGSSQNITNKFNMTNKYSKHSAVDGGSESIINLSKSYYPYQAGSEIKSTNCFNLSPPTYGHHDLPEEYSLYKSRSESRSSSSSANSTGTVCESEIFPYGAGIKPHQPHQRMLRSTSPPSRTVTPPPGENKTNKNKPKANDESHTSGELESKLSEKRQGKRQSVKAVPAVATSDLLIDNLVSRGETSPDKASVSTASSLGLRARMEPPAEVDDVQSVSTVSGSGIEFFRKFVQRKGHTEGVLAIAPNSCTTPM